MRPSAVILSCIAFAALAASEAGTAPRPGMTLGPAMYRIEGLPLGQEADLSTVGGLTFTVGNGSSQPLDATIAAVRPTDGGMPRWELGYTEIPDASWFRCEPAHVTLAPGATATVRVFARLPDDPALADRRFVLGVCMRTGGPARVGSGLGLCARVLIETAHREVPDAARPGPLVLNPAILDLGTVPAGGNASGGTVVRQTGDAAQTLAVRRLAEVEPDPERHGRYRAHPPGDPAWLTFSPRVELGPRGASVLRAEVAVPAGATPGSYEEIVFLGAEDVLTGWAAARDAFPRQPQAAFVRVRWAVPQR